VNTQTRFDEVFESVRDIDGWLTKAQARLLYERAAALPPGARIVEIGSHHGRSTIVLATAAPEAELIAIDPYEENQPRPDDLERFERNLERAGVRERVRHVHAPSTAALAHVPGEIDLLYIDGAHDLKTAHADIRGWGARVRDGGTMLIHDSFSSVGVTLAEILSLFFGERFRYIGRSRTLAEYRREHLPSAERAVNASRQAVSLPWFVRNVLVKVALLGKVTVVARALGHQDRVFPY
jgi:predicted O-methyltransferase YrrM